MFIEKVYSKRLKKGAIESKTKYIRNKIIVKEFLKQNEKRFYSNLELIQITDNELFWKTIKTFLSDKRI